jgi:Rieske Fe-S protein
MINESPSRRRFFSMLTTVSLGGVGIGLAVPAVLFLLFPVGRRTVRSADGFVPLGPLDKFPEGVMTRAEVIAEQTDAWTTTPAATLGAVWVRREPRSLEVFTSACPHLGCDVDWIAEEKRFECPCHESAYAPDGRRMLGPARRGLDRLEHRVQNGVLEVRFQRFKNDDPEKVPL